MMRVKFLKGRQKLFLNNVKKLTDLNWSQIAAICKIHSRTLQDWKTEKYQMNYESLKNLCRVSNVLLPKNIKVLPEYWSTKKAARLGAIKRNELYGNPGTSEGRKKGGMTSSLKFQMNPEFAKKVGFKVRKQIFYPQISSLLTEFIGIVLGDGTISEYQVKISTNSKTDRLHAYFTKKLVIDLFNIVPTIRIRKKNTLDIIISSKNLVNFLLSCGLKKGDKILQGVDVPKWIFRDKELVKGCLRGLIDSDGSIYFHIHTTKGIKYRNMGLCFTSRSRPLLTSVYRMFLDLGIAAKSDKKKHVSIYDRKEINRYMQIVGSHNLKHIKRFKSYKNSKIY